MLATVAGAAEIGIYFDASATENCRPEIASYPYVIQAYIVATGCAESGGIRAWEATLRWDSSLVVVPGAVSGDEINVRAFPDYVVGLAAALPDSDTVLLAALNVMATGPGAMYIRGPGVSSPDSLPCVEFEGSERIESFGYRFGSLTEPVASIGISNCPSFAPEPALLVRDVPLSPKTSELRTDEAALAASTEFADEHVAADVCFAGTILSAHMRCVDFAAGNVPGVAGHSVAAMSIMVSTDHRFWGVVADTNEVLVLGYPLQGCSRNPQQLRLPPIGQVRPGVPCFVSARRVRGELVVSHWETFRVLEQAVKGGNLPLEFQKFAIFGDDEQMRSAVRVVDARLKSIGRDTVRYRVVRQLKGSGEALVEIERKTTQDKFTRFGNRGDLMRLYLAVDNGRYVLLHGRRSVQLIGEVEP